MGRFERLFRPDHEVEDNRRVAQGTEAWGGDPVLDATVESAWSKSVRAYAERRACRAERAAEWKARP